MSLNIKNPRTFEAAHELAAVTGETITAAVTIAIEERLAALLEKEVRERQGGLSVADIQAFVASLPDRDTRTPEEILGYDEFGFPG